MLGASGLRAVTASATAFRAVATSFGTSVATTTVTVSVATATVTTGFGTAAVTTGFGATAVTTGFGTSVAAATGMMTAAATTSATRRDTLFQALQLQADVFHPLLSPPFFSGFERLGFQIINSKAPLRIRVK